MKTNKKELDVDVIGGLGPLTKEEEKIISEFIKSNKSLKPKLTIFKTKSGSRKKIIPHVPTVV